MLIVNAALPFKTLKDIVDHAKANPGTLLYASPGQGSSQHLAVELLRTMAGNINMTHLPYSGSGPGVTAVMGGEAQLMMPATPSALPGIKSGKARAIAVSSLKRHPDFPDLPTIAETFPGYEVTSWFGLAAPAGTPKPVDRHAQRRDAQGARQSGGDQGARLPASSRRSARRRNSAPSSRPRSRSGPRSRARPT